MVNCRASQTAAESEVPGRGPGSGTAAAAAVIASQSESSREHPSQAIAGRALRKPAAAATPGVSESGLGAHGRENLSFRASLSLSEMEGRERMEGNNWTVTQVSICEIGTTENHT